MSSVYNLYIEGHLLAVQSAYQWMRAYYPNFQKWSTPLLEIQIIRDHDRSKLSKEEYDAYDKKFYPDFADKGLEMMDVDLAFKRAWLHHIHANPHHWQHWVLLNDDPSEGQEALLMPIEYIIEMVCDWWSFSWMKGDLNEVFDWYEERKNYIVLHPHSRQQVEGILNTIRETLFEMKMDRADDYSESVIREYVVSPEARQTATALFFGKD